MSALRELFAKFQIDVDTKELKKGHEQVEGFKEVLEKAVSTFADAFLGTEVIEFGKRTIEAAAHVGDLSERLGISTHDLQAFQFAAGLAGVDSENAAHALGLLNRQLGEAAKGGEAAKAFQELGIAVKGAGGQARPMAEVLGDAADQIAKLPDQGARAAAAMRLFGRSGQALLPVLQGGRKELEENLREFNELGGGMSEDFVKSAKKVDDDMQRLRLTMTALKTKALEAAMPYIQKLVDWMREAAKGAVDFAKNTTILKTGLMALSVVAGVRLAAALQKVLALLGLTNLPLILAVAGLYLAFDELYGLLEGKDTVLGRALGPDKEKFVADLRATVDLLKQSFQELWPIVQNVGQDIWAIDQSLEPLGTIAGPQRLSSAIQELAQQIAGATSNLVALIEAALQLRDLDFSGALETLESGTTVGRMLSGGPSAPTAFSLRSAFNSAAGLPAPVSPAAGTYGVGDAANMSRRTNAVNVVTHNGEHFDQVPAYMVQHTRGGRGESAGSPLVVNQTITNNIDVKTAATDADGTAKATTGAVATATQRATSKALTARTKP